ncbi:MAG: ATP-dependent DNA helicase RecG [Deltaproteobacteria bacterium]|nr:ATP-dependent DNA helicase RecG [Deltaproteobacteria bacterium]
MAEDTDRERPEVKSGRLTRAMSLILKPLGFASKDSFAHINSVKGLEGLVGRVCADVLGAGVDAEAAANVSALKALVSGFDGLDPEAKKERVASAVDIVNAIINKHSERIPRGSPRGGASELQTMNSLLENSPRLVAENFNPPAVHRYSMSGEELKKRLQAIKTPLQYVRGIGPRLAQRLEKKGLRTVEDMLYFLPMRYEDRRALKKIRDLSPGPGQTVVAEVLASGETRYGRRKVFEAALGDGSGILKAKWFNYKAAYMKERFKTGRRLSLYGAVSVFDRQMEMIHPDAEPCDTDGPEDERQDLQGIVPVYSQIENFHQKTVRKIVRGVVEAYAGLALPGVPADVLGRHALPDINAAFIEAHTPSGSGALTPATAKKGLVFDELFLLELGMLLRKREIKKERGIGFSFDGALEGRFKKLLPFKLTGAQERALEEVRCDMMAPHPMNRLVQGDVGSGKTVVAFIAALNAIEGGYQAAIMAPTEILAEQHYLFARRYAEGIGVNTVLLTGGMKGPSKRKAADDAASGRAGLVIGTHALIQREVAFKRLGLAVIDEQHRFGVVQRAALKKKAASDGADVCPDILIMTATPIPRTLSMTVFGDLDVSVIDELPPGRHPVITRIMREGERERAYGLIRKELESGSQCYVVYPLVEESEELSLRDATNMKERLQKEVFADYNVGLLHGRMKSAEKESVMREFKDGNLHILVSTTVIEVGVDVPNATVILIEHAERFGLAQLHQLRGRVGRGDKRSICLLLAAWTNSEETYRRLKVMEETMDGFRY